MNEELNAIANQVLLRLMQNFATDCGLRAVQITPEGTQLERLPIPVLVGKPLYLVEEV